MQPTVRTGDDPMPVRRRSSRVPGSSALEKPSVALLLDRVRGNDPRVTVLKLHDYLSADTSMPVIDAVLDALKHNCNCQALYIQNVSRGFRDKQLQALARVLRRGNIWCLNAGENDRITQLGWWDFAEELKHTNVTHIYLSEHIISTELKTAVRDAVRDNRRKHVRHCSASNLEVIRQCTHMWWDPLNSKKLQQDDES